MKNTCWRLGSLLLVFSLGMPACQKIEGDPTATPDHESIQAASTLFAQPTRDIRSTPSPTPANEIELALSRTIARMEQAVLAGDVDTYMTYVWQEDPVFLADHTRWANDWQQYPLSVFKIELFGIQSISPSEALARMTIQWTQPSSLERSYSGGSTITARFFHDGDDWRFGGEQWETVDFEGIRFYYFYNDALDNRPQAAVVEEYLPRVHARLTRDFDFTPAHTAHLKMYESTVTLQNWTRLSIPILSRWNEPGESIKITLGPSATPPYEVDVAREYTRFMLYEMSENTPENFPWWLEEGLSEYGAAMFRTLSQRNRVIKRIAARSRAGENAEDRLLTWDQLETRPDLDAEGVEVAVNQAFTLVHFVTETYGTEARNAWVAAVAAAQPVEDACLEHLGVSFADLNAAWLAWLPEQL